MSLVRIDGLHFTMQTTLLRRSVGLILIRVFSSVSRHGMVAVFHLPVTGLCLHLLALLSTRRVILLELGDFFGNLCLDFVKLIVDTVFLVRPQFPRTIVLPRPALAPSPHVDFEIHPPASAHSSSAESSPHSASAHA